MDQQASTFNYTKNPAHTFEEKRSSRTQKWILIGILIWITAILSVVSIVWINWEREEPWSEEVYYGDGRVRGGPRRTSPLSASYVAPANTQPENNVSGSSSEDTRLTGEVARSDDHIIVIVRTSNNEHDQNIHSNESPDEIINDPINPINPSTHETLSDPEDDFVQINNQLE